MEPELDESGDLEQDAAKVVLSEEALTQLMAEAAERAAEAASRRAVEEARTALEAKLDALTGQKAGAGSADSEGESEEEANEVVKEEAAAAGPSKSWSSEEELQYLQAKYIAELQAQGKDADVLACERVPRSSGPSSAKRSTLMAGIRQTGQPQKGRASAFVRLKGQSCEGRRISLKTLKGKP
eukprot:SAG22_NODE_33_length_27588_cov_104.174652_17_plen_183_part_00